MAVERVVGPTPNGGAYAEIYLLDDEGNDAERPAATACEVVEYTAEGEQLFRVYAKLIPEEETQDERSRSERPWLED